MRSIDFLIVGSPTPVFRDTRPVQAFIQRLTENAFKGINVAAFDTRMPESDVGKSPCFIMKMGGNLGAPPEGFFVKDKEGPLEEGDLERAANRVKEIAK